MRHYWCPHICWYRNHHNFFIDWYQDFVGWDVMTVRNYVEHPLTYTPSAKRLEQSCAGEKTEACERVAGAHFHKVWTRGAVLGESTKVPSGSQTWLAGQFTNQMEVSMGKSINQYIYIIIYIDGEFSIAMFDCQKVVTFTNKISGYGPIWTSNTWGKKSPTNW